ncbi:MAG TPA: hypothetical protein EYP58_01725 [bacterium (Candidatus Stahlbacteria)]|nr:hypothetical protein [Candidatus Stahlbacteria bacterium]
MPIIIFIASLISTGLDSIYYRYLPLDTNLYQKIEIVGGEDDDIRLSGTKSFLVSYGASGLVVDQGMWVNFSGNTGDLTIEGSIADQEGEGDITKGLFEVENTRVGFIAPWGSGQVGDLILSHNLLTGKIRQQGVGGELGVGPLTTGLVVARGYYRRRRIVPQDHQGPYLVDDQGIIPGSEQIYFNGIPVLKGDDYLIDYQSGEITFTPTRPVSPIDRIEVDYLSASVRFLKLSSYGKAVYKDHRIGFLGDFEDPSRPIGFEIDAERRSAFESAGDSMIWIDGGDTIAGGDYLKVEDHYQFAGFGEGNYRVQFTYVGGDSGDYVYDQTIHAYRYTGNSGDYVAKVKIYPPQKSRFVYTNSEFKIGSMKATLEPAVAVSDQNLLSSRDDEDNLGLGFGGRLEYENGLRAYLDAYDRNENFQFPIQSEYDLNYLWGADSEVVMLSRYQAGLLAHYSGVDLNLGAGLLNRRWPRVFIKTDFKNGHLGYSRFRKRYRFDGGYDLPVYFVVPGIGVLLEDDRRLSYLQLRIPEVFKVQYKMVEDTLGKGNGFDLLLSPSLGPLEGTLSWTRNTWEGRNWDLASLSASTTYPFSITGSFNLNREVKRRYDEFYVEVDPNEGDYRLDTITGRYIRDPGGNYIRKIHYLDEYDITSTYIYRLLSDFEYGSMEISANLDDARTEFRSGGDLFLPIGLFDLSASGDYTRNREKIFDAKDSDLDIETGPYFRLNRFWRVGPFGHYHKAEESESGTRIRDETTTGGKVRTSISSTMGIEAYIGYDLIKASSPAYFPEIGTVLIRKPLLGIDLYFPIMGFRLFSFVDLSYIYSEEDLPGFLSILHPTGYNGVYRVGFDRKLTEKSTLTLSYHGRFHPEYKWDHNLSFSSRLRF